MIRMFRCDDTVDQGPVKTGEMLLDGKRATGHFACPASGLCPLILRDGGLLEVTGSCKIKKPASKLPTGLVKWVGQGQRRAQVTSAVPSRGAYSPTARGVRCPFRCK